MNVGCPQCSSVFRVDPAKVPPGGVRARCSICGGVIPVPEPIAELIGTPSSWSAPPYVRLSPPEGQPRMATPAQGSPVLATPTPTPTPSPAFATPSAGSAPYVTPAAESPRVTTPVMARPASINPYLTRDPDVRAKRLARALISDIVTYYPEKHADAASAGTLQNVFREEIKKSYEEYVAQVGQTFAEGTAHFQQALNEVLAEGKSVF